MNIKEVSELRRRWRADKLNAAHIYGCFVNTKGEIVADLDESLAMLPEEEAEKYLSLLKKTLSGTLGKNLIDIVFTTQQVADSPEHKLLMSLRSTELRDPVFRRDLYDRITGSLELDANYLVLLAGESYDVPRKAKDGENADSETVFQYFLCCACPVKETPPQLGYFPGDNEFHYTANQIVSAPEVGFLFPAFDDRAANIYNALYYTRNPGNLHHELIEAVFKAEPPMTAAEQKEAFETALLDALEEDCSMEVVRTLQEGLTARLEEHKESGDPEPLTVTPKEVGLMLRDCGVPEEREAAFRENCAQAFGEAAVLNPANLVEGKKFEVRTEKAAVSVDWEDGYLVETRVIDGRRYLLIPAEESVEVNGLAVRLTAPAEEA